MPTPEALSAAMLAAALAVEKRGVLMNMMVKDRPGHWTAKRLASWIMGGRWPWKGAGNTTTFIAVDAPSIRSSLACSASTQTRLLALTSKFWFPLVGHNTVLYHSFYYCIAL
uniref:Uncharacterized protein n=1 Tax=Nymphaea colorata TaxID=210225 RepID=A0A5K0VMK3_9MAGN